jgi:rod shape-determining protein MreB
MTGGGALIHGLDKLIEFKTGVATTVAEDSVECVAKGTGKVLGYIDKLDSKTNSQQIIFIE